MINEGCELCFCDKYELLQSTSRSTVPVLVNLQRSNTVDCQPGTGHDVKFVHAGDAIRKKAQRESVFFLAVSPEKSHIRYDMSHSLLLLQLRECEFLGQRNEQERYR